MKQDDGTQPSDVGLKVSDWITFLSSEKSSGLGNVIGAAGVFIAAIVVVLGNGWTSTSSDPHVGYAWVVWVRVAATVISGGLFIFLGVNTLRALGKPATKAEKLLDGIMRGDKTLRTEQQIRQAWIRLNKRKPRKAIGIPRNKPAEHV